MFTYVWGVDVSFNKLHYLEPVNFKHEIAGLLL